MRVSLLLSLVLLFAACNSSGKKDPNQAMDDTARMRDPAYVVTVSATKMALTDIPSSLTVLGKVEEAWKWNDRLGENMLLLSSVAIHDDKQKTPDGEDARSAELYVVHYARQDKDFVQVWLLSDGEKSCPFDITCGFIPGSTTFTDLDKDGIAEIKIQYMIACRSDVSPALVKLNMYESGTKYGLTGSSWVPYGPELKFDVTENNANLERLIRPQDEMAAILQEYGRYENEKEFASAPPAFLPYARKEWVKYVQEKMGE